MGADKPPRTLQHFLASGGIASTDYSYSLCRGLLAFDILAIYPPFALSTCFDSLVGGGTFRWAATYPATAASYSMLGTHLRILQYKIVSLPFRRL